MPDGYHLVQKSTIPPQEVGVLDSVTAKQLGHLRDVPGISFTAVIPSSALKKGRSKVVIIPISVNITGPEEIAEMVGDALASVDGFLQHPCFLGSGIRYVNPHFFTAFEQPVDMREYIGPAKADANSTRAGRELNAILESLDMTSGLPAIYNDTIFSASQMILNPLKRYDELPSFVKVASRTYV